MVVGGGLAGAALALRLARANRRVVVLERETGPRDKVCGEFISREAGLYLEALGVDLPGLGAQPIKMVRVVAGRRDALIHLPFPALSLSRRALDAVLLARAAHEGADVWAGARVRALERQGAGWRARLDGGESVDAPTVFLATGKHDLRGWKRPASPQSDLIAFKLHWSPQPDQGAALFGRVELILFQGGYAGLQPVESGRINLCLVVQKRVYASHGADWTRFLTAVTEACPLFASRLDGAVPCASAPLAVAGLPYGHLYRGDSEVWRLGDQAAVIPPFTGDGMSIALHSACLAANHYLAGSPAMGYHRQLRVDLADSLGLATFLSRALVGREPLQKLLPPLANRWPDIVSRLAGATRIPAEALRRNGLLGAA